MATTNTPRTIADDFINGRKQSKKLASMPVVGSEIQSYGHHFPLLVREGDRLLFNPSKYSVTTSRHQRGVREALTQNGYIQTGMKLSGSGRHTFYIFEKH